MPYSIAVATAGSVAMGEVLPLLLFLAALALAVIFID